MIKYIKILGIIIVYILPFIMIIRFLINPQSGQGFATWRSTGSSKTLNCVVMSDYEKITDVTVKAGNSSILQKTEYDTKGNEIAGD